MRVSILRLMAFVLPITSTLQAIPDVGNLNNCIKDIRKAELLEPRVPIFDAYMADYAKLLEDLEQATAHLPYVYQEAAARPLIKFLEDLGEFKYLQIFQGEEESDEAQILLEIIPDAALAILSHEGETLKGVSAFQEIVSDLYDSFLSEESRVGKQTGRPIDPPTYGSIPPLVKFGNADDGPYTWPSDATSQILGMKCGIVSLPPAQLKGGLIAWSCLGHETAGHDVTHADEGLLDELAEKVYDALYAKFKSRSLAKYWARCMDETVADICGYLNMGPSLGIGLIGYFRALGDGILRSVGSLDDPHPIDLLRGYLAAAAVKRLNFSDSESWSYTIEKTTRKDNDALYLVDNEGNYQRFPVSFDKAVASTEVVAEVVMQSKLTSLQGHSLQELQDWTDPDQKRVDDLISIIKSGTKIPQAFLGPGFDASYVLAACTQAALESHANIPAIFKRMQDILAKMHHDNPTWALEATNESLARLEQGTKGIEKRSGQTAPHRLRSKVTANDELLAGQL